jgi:hypothetical protein
MTTPTIATSPVTGVEYYADGPLDGQSVKFYVPVLNGEVLNPRGVRWPSTNGDVHDKAEEYYEIAPFSPVPFDPKLFRVDDETSGLQLRPKRDQLGELVDVPKGHPQGTFVKVENIIRRSKAELRQLVQGYYARAQGELWPQNPGYAEMLAYAKEQIAANNEGQQFRDLVARHELLMSATFANQSRLDQLYAEIEAAGETGPIDFDPGEGWINGIEP